MGEDLASLLHDIRACRVCEAELGHDPRPVLQAGPGARVVIIGQAPGRRVHASGIPWDDPSGVTLRDWLGVDRQVFYDPEQIVLLPMGFCYPGAGSGGDLPPRPECAPLWHDRVLAHLPADSLRVIIGAYAQARYLPAPRTSVTEAVRGWRRHLPEMVVLPHPSPRNRRWLAANPWFAAEVLPAVRRRVAEVLGPRR